MSSSTSNRLSDAFQAARSTGRKLLCPFFTAGYPSLEVSAELLRVGQDAGAGCIELGIPFSDPVADGPVIQASFTHALAHGTTVNKALNVAAAARKNGVTVPIMAMVSFSIIFKRGTGDFAAACRDAGLDGIILPDIPLEEAPAVAEAIERTGLKTCLLVAPTTPPERRTQIARLCSGFVYYLSVSGITGERRELPPDIAANVAALRAVASVPVAVGFGISTAADVRQVLQVADGAIVGSAIVRRIAEHAADGPGKLQDAVSQLIRDLAQGIP